MSDHSMTNMLLERFGAEVTADVLAEFRTGWELDKTLSAISQRKIAQAFRHEESAHMDGMGQHVARVDLTSFIYWQARTHGKAWQDPAFIREYLRDNEDARVRSRSRKTTIVAPGMPSSSSPAIILS